MNGSKLIGTLKRQMVVVTDEALASRLGLTTQSIQNWKNRKTITSRQLVGLIRRASKAATTSFQAKAIRPLVEFYPITKCSSKQGARLELFQVTSEDGTNHPYRNGLREELESHHGVYVFFDSRGQAIYAGKARAQSLWNEMTNALNRNRDQVQKIKRVRHPERRQKYRTNEEKVRQIDEYAVPLHDLAYYFSAYDVTDTMVADVEALLVRSFANNLLNIRMERFGNHKKE